ncbi:endonuclease/exonuclease/phosphatase family protein [Clostridium botulinum]|nr:endonuclease/exonuclease/phosphatase family protein [Clostridium botulinum]
MQVLCLDTNGFSGSESKKSREMKNRSIAKTIIEKILQKVEPEIIIFSEFDVNSLAGRYVMEYLEWKGDYCVYPNNYTYISKMYISIVLKFAKRKITSTSSLGIELKWNEILYGNYRIVGVHIPDSKNEYDRAVKYWTDLSSHYQNHKNEKLLYIGDMNVFKDDSYGKGMLNDLLNCEAKDGWIETGHTNNKLKDFTFIGKTRVDYAIMSQKTLEYVNYMQNFQEFFEKRLSDHSALLVDLK